MQCRWFRGADALFRTELSPQRLRLCHVQHREVGNFSAHDCFGLNGLAAGSSVYCLPMVGMAVRHARKVADSWADFQRRIKR